MSNYYNIGQFRYSKDVTFTSPEIISYNDNIDIQDGMNETCKYENMGGNIYELLLNHSFQGLTTYHMRVSLASLGPGENNQIFTIKLKGNSSDPNRVQIIKTFELDNTNKEIGDEHVINFVFTPKANFSKMIFELQRTPKLDYNVTHPRKMSFYTQKIKQENDIEKQIVQLPELLSIKNILSTELSSVLGTNQIIKKLGIQGPTDLVFYVNGEPIILGQSQRFELYRPDFNIYSVGFVIKDNARDKEFIMDYCY